MRSDVLADLLAVAAVVEVVVAQLLHVRIRRIVLAVYDRHLERIPRLRPRVHPERPPAPVVPGQLQVVALLPNP